MIRKKVLTLFGTRPELIKLAPVIAAVEAAGTFTTVNVSSSQHTDLLRPLIKDFGVRVDHDLAVMQPNQTLSGLFARVLSALDPILVAEQPDVVLVQGDTTTAVAGATAAFHRKIPVGHVEAGLRSGNRDNPFPEEMNRRLITKLATWHFASTPENVAALRGEHVPEPQIFLTGNPVVDALLKMAADAKPTPETAALLTRIGDRKIILLTTHRRESFGEKMAGNLRALRDFVGNNPDVAIVFPTHPNPSVKGTAAEILGNRDGIFLVPPMDYRQFVLLMSRAWLIASDSGGVQEEAPSLGKPLLVLRENTERPEAVAAGCAKLVGTPELLAAELAAARVPGGWASGIRSVKNPFGDGTAAIKIAAALTECIGADAFGA
jgi:UDP-N-acetylglucosamine 2-epimerase (non-hydrolysing)